MTKPKTVMATWLVSVVELLVAQGLDRTKLTAGLWGNDAARSMPTRQFDLVLARRLWQRAVALSSDPLLGLKVGAALPLQAMNIITVLIIHSANLREALKHAVRYQRLVSNSGTLSLRARTGGVLMHYALTPSPVAMPQAQIDSLFVGILELIKRCSNHPGVRPKLITLISPRTELENSYSAFYGCPVKCGASITSLDYDDDALDSVFPGADPSVLALARGHAEVMLRAQNQADSLAASVRASVATNGFAEISCTQVARELGISTRTLQRRLTEIRTTFRSLVEATRMDEAFTLLSASQLTVAEICDQLGYSEPSSFSHAVKAYWGVTPRDLHQRGASIAQA